MAAGQQRRASERLCVPLSAEGDREGQGDREGASAEPLCDFGERICHRVEVLAGEDTLSVTACSRTGPG